MYRKELPVGDRVTEEPSSAYDIGDQLSEYDSDSSNEEDSATHEEDAVEAVPVNFLSKTVRTRDDRSRFHNVLFIHTDVQKALSFCRSLFKKHA